MERLTGFIHERKNIYEFLVSVGDASNDGAQKTKPG